MTCEHLNREEVYCEYFDHALTIDSIVNLSVAQAVQEALAKQRNEIIDLIDETYSDIYDPDALCDLLDLLKDSTKEE
jgi:hypothetical protein